MAYDKFLIAPFDENSGLTTNVRPWQIPDSAWSQLENMYVFRGRLKKRFGSHLAGNGIDLTSISQASRLRINVATTAVTTGNLTSTTMPGTKWGIGQQFSVGATTFTVYQASGATYTTGLATATYDTSNGHLVITGNGENPSTAVYFYPSLPVMGLSQYEFSAINNYLSIGFDTQFAYAYSAGSWGLSTGSPTWHGTDTNFFWTTNWVGLDQSITTLERTLFATNFYAVNPNGVGTATDDPIYYYNNSTWTAFTPHYFPNGGAPDSGPFVQTALIIVPFHNRLLLFNTIENDGTGNGTTTFGNNTNYVNRVRYSFLGSPFWNNSFYQQGQRDNSGNANTSIGTTAGFLDAATLEAIVSIGFIKDRLIVYFENSTWELAYTGNEQEPFSWQKLNSELGSMSTFSSVQFDKALLSVGEVGFHACNGSNVTRIDQKIPTSVFEIANPFTGAERTCGIRDFFNEMVYWAASYGLPYSNQPYPNKIFAYNYQNETWALFDDVITAFGYFDSQTAQTWATLQGTWADWDSPWDSGNEWPQVRAIIAGNQQGFTFILDAEDNASNAPAMQISSMTQVANGIQMYIDNHMLSQGDYIQIQNAAGVTLNGNGIYVVDSVYTGGSIDPNLIIARYPAEINTAPTFTGTYEGQGLVSRVSNYSMYSKQWNPYDKDGSNVYVAKIDFAVVKTPNNTDVNGKPIPGTGGQVTVNYSPSSTPLDSIQEGIDTDTIMGTSILETSPYPVYLYPLEQKQTRLWHTLYLQTDGECVQINIYMSPAQMCDPTISLANFEIEGIILYTQKVGRLQ